MTSERKERFVLAAAFLTFAVGFFLVAAVLLTLYFAPYELVLRFSRLATGSRNPLNPAQYSALASRMGGGGLFYGLLGLVLLLFRRRLADWTAQRIAELRTWFLRSSQIVVQTTRTKSRWHLVSMVLITVIGIVLRLLYLGEPPRGDESFTYISYASRSIVHVLVLYPTPNNHILHSALEWISCRIFGGSLWAMRLPALLAGIAIIPLTYVTGRRLAGRTVALIAAGLIAVSGPFVLYSVNARGYTLQAGLLVIMLYLGAEIASGAPAVCWLLFSVAAAAGFWTSPTMLYSYLIASIWLLWAGGSIQLRPIVISGLLTAIVVIFLYMPVFVVSGPQSVFHNPWVQPLPVQEFRAEASRFPDELVKFLHGADPLLLPIVVGLGVVVGILFRSRVTRYRGHLFVVAVIVVLAVSLGHRIVPFPRVLLPVYIAYYLSSAFGLSILTDEIFSRYELPALAALMSLLCVVAFHMTRSGYIEAHRQFPESRAVAAYLISQLRPCDRLIFSLSTEPEVKWQLRHDNISYHDYSKDEKTPERVLMTAQELTVLPPRGNGLLDPSLLTLEGTLRASGLNTADYLSAELVYKIGRGEVFKLTPRHPSDGCHAH